MTKQGGWPATGFGARLRELRTSAGLTHAQLAEQAGCNVFMISKLERGLHEPAWPLVLALCRALAVTPDAFLVPATTTPEEKPRRGRPRKTEERTAPAGEGKTRKRKT